MSDQPAAPYRERFPILTTKSYLASCSYGALSLDVEAAVQEYLQLRHRVGADWGAWIGKQERIRALLAELLDAPARDIAITTSLSQGVNAVASALNLTAPRNEIVVTEFDFPTTAQIWHAQAARGARVLTVRADASSQRLPLAAFEALITDRTALVAVPLICYWNGARVDVEPIIRLAHERGARVFVDAYQAVGTFPISCRTLGADFLGAGCTKYLIGSAGIGFVHVRDSERSPLQPTATGWFAQEDTHAMDASRHAPARDARRFESGTPNVPALYPAEAGLELLRSVGQPVIWQTIEGLTAQIIDEARQAGIRLATPTGSGQYGAMIALATGNEAMLVNALQSDGVIVTSRRGNLRVAPHFYNNATDVDALFRALRRRQSLIAG
jgi:selenocysteine lyase/cysteine desulfurase